MAIHNNYWLGRNVVARRRVLGGGVAAGAGLAAMALAGCGDDSTTGGGGSSATAAGPTTAVQPKRGGTLTLAATTMTALDIHLESISGPSTVAGMAYNRLLRYQPDVELAEPDLAAKLPEQPDQTTYIFTLRDGVKFQNKAPVNGRLLTAEDVVFSLNRARTPNNPLYIHASLLNPIDKIEAPDSKTVKITTKSPNAVFTTTLSGPQFIVIAQEVLKQFPDLKTDAATVGTGPYIVDSFKSDTGAQLVRNPDYWKPGMPYFDKVSVTKPADTWSAFLSGKLDLTGIPAEQEDGVKSFDEVLKKNNLSGTTQFRSPDFIAAFHHAMNSTAKPFNDLRVRQAINLILDRDPQLKYGWPLENIYSIALGYGAFKAGFGLPQAEMMTLPGFRRDKRDQDIKDGLALLAQAGYTKDNPCKFDIMGWSTPARSCCGVDTLQLGADMYKQVSGNVIQATVNGLDFGVWKQAEARKDFRMINSAYNAGPDPHDTLNAWYQSKGGRNYSGFADPAFDAMLDKEVATFDLTQRKKLIQDMLRYVNDPSRLTIAWLGYGATLNVSAGGIQGVPPMWDSSRVEQLWHA